MLDRESFVLTGNPSLRRSDGANLARSSLVVEFLAGDGSRSHSIRTRILLFDLDGTLVDSQAVVQRHMRQWARRHALDEQAVVDFSHGRRDIDVIRELTPHTDPDEELAWLDRLSCADVEGVRPADGAARLLAELKTSQWGVVTSATSVVCTRRLAAAGLPVPDVVVCADDVEHGKPSPQGYLAAADRFGVPASECLVVEDAEAGVRAALAAGMPALSVAGPSNPVHGHRIAGLDALSVTSC